MADYGKTVVIDVLTKALVGMGVGSIVDMLVEVFRIPILNDTGTFGASDISNFELAGYGIMVLGVTAGSADLALSKGVLTFSKDTLFYFLGWGLGIYYYEHTLASLLGIRKFNPYTTIGQYVPPVLPSSTQLPFINYDPIPGGVPVAPMVH